MRNRGLTLRPVSAKELESKRRDALKASRAVHANESRERIVAQRKAHQERQQQLGFKGPTVRVREIALPPLPEAKVYGGPGGNEREDTEKCESTAASLDKELEGQGSGPMDGQNIAEALDRRTDALYDQHRRLMLSGVTISETHVVRRQRVELPPSAPVPVLSGGLESISGPLISAVRLHKAKNSRAGLQDKLGVVLSHRDGWAQVALLETGDVVKWRAGPSNLVPVMVLREQLEKSPALKVIQSMNLSSSASEANSSPAAAPSVRATTDNPQTNLQSHPRKLFGKNGVVLRDSHSVIVPPPTVSLIKFESC